jgi:hypothetical protein
MFKTIIRCIALSVAMSALPAGAAQDALAKTPYPSVPPDEFANWQYLLVVAKLTAGDYHERTCPASNETRVVICMDPPPFWFHAKIDTILHGADLPVQVRVSTTSHFGISEYKKERGLFLVALRSDGSTYVMPRYQNSALIRDKRGALFLPVTSNVPLSWLPCDTAALREEISPDQFDGSHGIAIYGPQDHKSKQQSGLFNIAGETAFPRYAVGIERLRDFLIKAGPDVQMSCAPQAASNRPR